MSEIWQITLFGGLRVQRGEQALTRFKFQKAAALLAYLSCYQDRSHPREVLMELLWPESDLEAGRNSLNVTFSRLRKDLDMLGTTSDFLLLSDRHHIGINSAVVSTDVALFSVNLANAERAGNETIKIQSLESAISLYAGPLLPGFYDAWVLAEQERLRERLNQALICLVTLLERQGRWEEAIGYARRVVTVEPLLEKGHENLIRLLIQAGRPADALQQYRALERLLREEMGIAPSEQTHALLEQISQANKVSILRENSFSCAEFPPPGNLLPATSALPPPELSIPMSVEASRVEPVTPVLQPAGERSQHRIAARIVGVATLMLLAMLISVTSRPHTPVLSHTPAPKAGEGGKRLWEWQYHPTNEEKDSEPTAITSDAAGNLYVCGFVDTKTSDVDFMTLKFGPDGNLLWKRRWNQPTVNDCDRARYIAVDSAGNVYVTGESYGGDREKGGTQWDVETVKYDPNGHRLWERRFNDPPHDDDKPVGLALDNTGNVYVAASVARPDKTETFALMKYSATGRILWTERYQPAREYGQVTDCKTHAFRADEDGSICLTGEATMRDLLGQKSRYILTVRYDRQGNQMWQRRFAAEPTGISTGRVVTTDTAHNIYVAATVQGTGDKGANDDMIVIKYDPTGAEVWSTQCHLESCPLVIPKGLVVDRNGNVFAACTHGLGGSGMGFAVCALAPDGRKQREDSAPHVEVSGILLGQDGGISLTGSAWYGGPFDDMNTLFIWRYTPDGKRRWTRNYEVVSADNRPRMIHSLAFYQDTHGCLITACQAFYGPHRNLFLLKYSP